MRKMIIFALKIERIMEKLTERIGRKRLFPTVGDVLVMLLLFAVTQVVSSGVLQALGVVAPAVSSIDAVDIETYMNEQYALARCVAIMHPVSFILSIVVLWLYARIRGGRKVIRIRHSASGFNPTLILVGVLWLLTAQMILEPLLELFPSNEGQGLGRGFWAAFTAIVSASVLEEVLCRGVWFEVLYRRWGAATSILISSLFFGILHFDISNAIVAVVAGFIFGLLYLRTSSLYVTIIIHSINNAIAFALISFGAGDMSFRELLGGGLIYYVAYAVAVVVLVVISVEESIKVFRGERAK